MPNTDLINAVSKTIEFSLDGGLLKKGEFGPEGSINIKRDVWDRHRVKLVRFADYEDAPKNTIHYTGPYHGVRTEYEAWVKTKTSHI